MVEQNTAHAEMMTNPPTHISSHTEYRYIPTVHTDTCVFLNSCDHVTFGMSVIQPMACKIDSKNEMLMGRQATVSRRRYWVVLNILYTLFLLLFAPTNFNVFWR